jgi:hypothetical protein
MSRHLGAAPAAELPTRYRRGSSGEASSSHSAITHFSEANLPAYSTTGSVFTQSAADVANAKKDPAGTLS